MNKTIIVLPAYNAEKTIIKTINEIPAGVAEKIIVVDDFSDDDTFEKVKDIPNVISVKHDNNLGYGANQKTCYDLALKEGADIIAMLHPDYQYDPKLLPYMTGLIKDGLYDVVLGTRITSRKDCLDGGMPLYKYVMNRLLTIIQNLLSGKNLSEWHTGYRCYSRKVLDKIDYNSNPNDYLFDSKMLYQIYSNNFTIGEISVPTRYNQNSSSINFINGIKYSLGTLYFAVKYLLFKNVY